MQLLRVLRHERPTRFYINGRRVTSDRYNDTIAERSRAGRRLNSLISRTTYDKTGQAIQRLWSCI